METNYYVINDISTLEIITTTIRDTIARHIDGKIWSIFSRSIDVPTIEDIICAFDKQTVKE